MFKKIYETLEKIIEQNTIIISQNNQMAEMIQKMWDESHPMTMGGK